MKPGIITLADPRDADNFEIGYTTSAVGDGAFCLVTAVDPLLGIITVRAPTRRERFKRPVLILRSRVRYSRLGVWLLGY